MKILLESGEYVIKIFTMKIIRFFIVLTVVLGGSFSSNASNALKPKTTDWPFDGAFGYFDKRSIQRGFQVYKEVCQACHSLNHIAYRNLEEIGFSHKEVKAIAADYQVQDGPNDQGEMFMRPGRPSDIFVSTYPNEQAARAANNGAHPPDLSLMIKARPDGANYVHSLLTGYSDAPADFHMNPGMHYNVYFPGHQIAMPPPLSAGVVTYTDGTEATVEQMSQDVVMFLQWAAEPEMEKRKIMGIKAMLYLFAFTIIFYLAKRKIWSDVK